MRQPAKAADEAVAGASSSGSGIASAQSSLAQACGELCSCACATPGTAGAAAGLEGGVGADGLWSGAAAPLLGSISEGLQPQVNFGKPRIGNAAGCGDMPLPVSWRITPWWLDLGCRHLSGQIDAHGEACTSAYHLG